jgi:Stress responsive A/B Barrel Domain
MTAIKHIVMWNLRGETPEEKAAARLKVKAAFEGLKGLIHGLKHIEVGIDVVLVSEFENISDLKSYATHPEHLRVRNELGDLRVGRHQVDYHIEADGLASVSQA